MSNIIYKKLELSKTVKNINSCANAFYLETYKNINNVEVSEKTWGNESIKEKVKPFTTCKHKFCSNCAYLKSRRLFVNTYKILEQMEIDKVEYIAYHLTLTVKNPLVKDFKKTLDTMNNAFRLMFRQSSKYQFKNYVLGYQASRETTQSSEAKARNELHPHIHTLLLLKPDFYNAKCRNSRMTKQQILAEWNSALKHYDPNFPIATQIDFKQIRTVKDCQELVNLEHNAIAEVSKYPVKISDLKNMNIEDFEVLDKELHNKRLMTFGGLIKEYRAKLKLEDTTEDTFLNEQSYKLIQVQLYKLIESKYKNIEMNLHDKVNYNEIKQQIYFDIEKEKEEIKKQKAW